MEKDITLEYAAFLRSFKRNIQELYLFPLLRFYKLFSIAQR